MAFSALLRTLLLISTVSVAVCTWGADTVPTDIQQPGTQPGEISSLESPNKCDNCHGGYDSAVEPAHNWRGSMMAHAGRDPIFWATLAVAEQDFEGSGDLCLRCHAPAGWLGGRSTPTDGSGLAAGDGDGVECDFCHKLTNPDNSEHLGVMTPPFIAADANEAYYGSGMASMWDGAAKLGPYADAEPKHQFMSSRFHRSADFCGTCHDVSNPAVGDLAANHGAQPSADPVTASGVPGAAVEDKAAFNNPPYKYGVVERTFSEYLAGALSRTRVADFPNLPADLQGGALLAVYSAATADGGNGDYKDGTPRYYTCQSCHLRPTTGAGANKRGLPVRTDLPLHDLTGGNYWMPQVIAYMNQQGSLRLGGDMSQASIDAMLAGAERAREQLDLAASLQVSGTTLKVINHTGHKLISGYPEGRRMWLHIRWYDAGGALLDEIGEYGALAVSDALVPGGSVESIVDLDDPRNRVYETHYGMTAQWARQLLAHGVSPDLPLAYDRQTGSILHTLGELAALPGDSDAFETFHFVLNNTVVKDNRIPPWGMDVEAARKRNALPVPADQYAGDTGSVYRYWDELDLATLGPAGAVSATVELLYQPTSWEYIQFLARANRGDSSFLGAEGSSLLDAWLQTGMAQPHLMASASWGSPPAQCDPDAPVLATALAGDQQVQLGWDVPGELPDSLASLTYALYYDVSGEAQHIADVAWPGNSYTDSGLNNAQEYCYKLAATAVTVEGCTAQSAYSAKICATPSTVAVIPIGVEDSLLSGRWEQQGRGKNVTNVFVVTDLFSAGDTVTVQGVVFGGEGTPAGAVVSLLVSDAQGIAVATLQSTAADDSGAFEVDWSTSAPNKKGVGGTAPGAYTARVTGVALDGAEWDASEVSVSFTIQ